MSVTPTYGKGQNASEYTPNEYAYLDPTQMRLIGKIAETIIREVNAKDPLAVFNKAPVDTGDTEEQIVVKLVESQGYDKAGANTLAPDNRDKLAVQYFKNWFKKVFKTTVYPNELRFVVDKISNKDELASKLVGVLGQSDIHEKFKDTKGLFLYGATPDTNGNTIFANGGTVATKNGEIDYLGFLKAVKKIVKGMKFVNSEYNTYGLERATDANDIYIVAPADLITDTDVDSLSGLFNLDKAEIRNRIIEIDTKPDDNGDYLVYIVDQNAIRIRTQTHVIKSQENAEGDFWNYYLHVTRMFALSTLFDGVFLKVSTPIQSPVTPTT